MFRSPLVAVALFPHESVSCMDLITKLQLKSGQSIECVEVPDLVRSALPTTRLSPGDEAEVGLVVFVVDRSTLDRHRDQIVSAVTSGRLTWVAYPKAGQLGTDLNRDPLAATLRADAIQSLRQIAIDGVWSALRFRPA
jgi:hypothetical protein